MTRVLIVYLLLFSLPFILFSVWRWLVKGARGRDEIAKNAPVTILFLLGLSLVGAGLSFLASDEKVGIEGRYQPPVFKDGKIEPGHFEKSEMSR